MQPSIKQIVTTLLEGTKNGTIEWETTSRKTEFRTNINAGSITVDKWDWTRQESDESGTTVDLAVFNKAGEKVDTCKADYGPDFKDLELLHETVRRKVLNVDETLESMFKELKIKVTGTHKSQ